MSGILFRRDTEMSLTTAWRDYRDANDPGSLSEHQWRSIEATFFAGAASLLHRILGAIEGAGEHEHDLPPDWLGMLLDEYRDNIDEHATAIMEKDRIDPP